MPIIFMSFILACGCISTSTKKVLREMYGAQLVLPSDMIVVKAGKTSLYKEQDGLSPLLLVYYDYAECGSCRISKLEYLDTLYSLSERSGLYEMLVVFSPSSEEVPEILSQLTVRNYHNAVSLFPDRYREASGFCRRSSGIVRHVEFIYRQDFRKVSIVVNTLTV